MTRRHGNRSQRRPGVETTCKSSDRQLAEQGFERLCTAVAAAPEPVDCPSCSGRGGGCGTCGGLGFVAEAEWGLALQRAFVAACGLVLPCEADEAEDGEVA